MLNKNTLFSVLRPVTLLSYHVMLFPIHFPRRLFSLGTQPFILPSTAPDLVPHSAITRSGAKLSITRSGVTLSITRSGATLSNNQIWCHTQPSLDLVPHLALTWSGATLCNYQIWFHTQQTPDLITYSVKTRSYYLEALLVSWRDNDDSRLITIRVIL